MRVALWRRLSSPMPLSFPGNGNSAEVVGQVGNLRRVGNPPNRPATANSNAGAGCRGTLWVARRIPSCPTINAGCSASQKLSGPGTPACRVPTHGDALGFDTASHAQPVPRLMECLKRHTSAASDPAAALHGTACRCGSGRACACGWTSLTALRSSPYSMTLLRYSDST